MFKRIRSRSIQRRIDKQSTFVQHPGAEFFGSGSSQVGGWSHDGKTLYYRVLSPDGSYDIGEVSADGSNPHVIIRFDRPDRSPYRADFSTDGTNFYFTIGEHLADIWVMDLRRK